MENQKEQIIRSQKAHYHFIAEVMQKLHNGEIANDIANTLSNLSKQMNNVVKLELDRAKVQIAIDEHNQNQNFKPIEIRPIESISIEKTI